jgi:hypothetical protein
LPRSRKQKIAARDRYQVEVDERTAEALDLDRVHRHLPVEEHLLLRVSRNYEAICSQRLSLDDVQALRGGPWR